MLSKLKPSKLIFILLLLTKCTYWPVANGLLLDFIESVNGNESPTSILLGLTQLNTELDYIYFNAVPESMTDGSDAEITIFAKIKNGASLDITKSEELVLTSADNSIVEVSAGRVRAVGIGTGSLTASFRGKIASAGIRVNGNLNPLSPPDTTPPTVTSAAAISPKIIRIVFSEDVNSTEATLVASYNIVFQSDVTGACSTNANFASTSTVGTLGAASTTNLGFNIASVTRVDARTYDLILSHNQFPNANYTVIVDRTVVKDIATTPNLLGCSNSANFSGDEDIKLLSVSCVNTSNLVLSFSKDVKGGLNLTGTGECDTTSTPNCNDVYKISSSLGNVMSARKLDGTICGGLAADAKKVCVNHSLPQSGATYSIQVADATDADGFENGSVGLVSNTIPSSPLKPSDDSATFTGCGTVPVTLADGILIDDPFRDGSTYGDLVSYLGNVVIGPNANGNKASRFALDGTGLTDLTFSLAKDINTLTGSRTQQNSFGGMSSSSPFVYNTIGKVGCTPHSGLLSNTCGPNNQDGRGVFYSATVGGIETLFLTGSKTSDGSGYPHNDYIYWTRDTDNNLDFNYIDSGAVLNSPPVNATSVGGATFQARHNSGTESLIIHNEHLYLSYISTDPKRPTILRLQDITVQEPTVSTLNRELSLFAMTNIGMIGSNLWNTMNLHQILGGTLYSFNNRVYLANTGNILFDPTTCSFANSSTYTASCNQKGGVIRSNNIDPASCTGFGNCASWLNISPSSSKYIQNFSNPLTRVVDLKAADRPIPAFETFNNKLYMIRNACRTVMMKDAYYWAPSTLNEGTCPVGNERPQLWKCSPALTGSTTDCDSGDWSLVAEDAVTLGASNFGDTFNRRITLLKRNGSMLYVGFNNPNGIKVYRTKIGVTDPSSVSDFEPVPGPTGINSFGATFVQEIFSAVSLQNGSIHNLYLSVGGKNGATPIPVKIFRQVNH